MYFIKPYELVEIKRLMRLANIRDARVRGKAQAVQKIIALEVETRLVSIKNCLSVFDTSQPHDAEFVGFIK